MKIKQLFKKAFTMVELVIVIAVVAVLAATSVGIYFGVMNSKPDEQSISIQEQVITLWEGYISDSTKYYDDIENKAFEFCTEYASKKGINVELNYRVLEFDDFVSSIVEANGIQRAYDPSGNAKEAVIIKIDTTYPSFFISTAYSVLKVNLPRPTEEMLIADIVKDPFVIESGLLTKYKLNQFSNAKDFYNFYELTPINVNGEIKRGIRYIRYLVSDINNKDNESYKPEYCVFGRANRTLNEECEGKYLPEFYEVNLYGMVFHTSTFYLHEDREGEDYYYDPNYFYDYFNNSFTFNEEYYKNEVYDKDTGKMVENELSISKFNSEFVVGEQHISYEPYLSYKGDDSFGAETDKPIDIMTPVDQQPSKPDIEDIPIEDVIKMYPICVYFAESIEIDIDKMPTMAGILNRLGFRDTKLQHLYFSDFSVLDGFINNLKFNELLVNSVNKTVYLYISDGAVLDTMLRIPNNFVFILYHRPEIEYKNGQANDIRIKNLEDITGKKEWSTLQFKDPALTQDINFMNLKNYSATQGTPYKVTWPEKPTKSLKITRNGLLILQTGSKLLVESNCYPTSYRAWGGLFDDHSPDPWGYTISEYAEIVNEGEIRLVSNAQARITGIIRSETGTGVINVSNTASISEPFRITDFLGRWNSNRAFINRGVFFSDFYYLDSIRCKLNLRDSAKYIGLITIRENRNATTEPTTFLGNIEIVSPSKYNSGCKINDLDRKCGSLFKLGPSGVFEKDYNETTKRASFKILKGNVSYSNAVIDCLTYYHTDLLGTNSNGYDASYVPAINKFTTETTGFKLSNIDFRICSDATFTMNGTDSISNTPRLEVLPNSSFVIEKDANLVLGKNCFININNFYSDSSIISSINSNIDKTDIYYETGDPANTLGNEGRRKEKSKVLLKERHTKLKECYDNNLVMFSNSGNIIIDNSASTLNQSDYKYETTSCQITKTHRHTGLIWDYYCKADYHVSASCTVSTISAAIYTWNNSKITGQFNLVRDEVKSTYTTKEILTDHTCKLNVTYGKNCDCKNNGKKTSYTIPLYITTTNGLINFKYGGGDACEMHPSHMLKF